MRTPILMLLCTAALACTTDPADDPITGDRWELIFEDEFKGEAGSPPSADNWTFETGTGANGWGNNELQYYTDRPDNAQLNGDGFLIITARREELEESDWTSARIITKDKFEFTYGRVEANIKLPLGKGLWPAFWMLGGNIDELSWPTCGEIDVMENFAYSADEVSGTIHGPGYSGGGAFGGEYTFPEGEDITGFHTYRIDWDPEHIAWYVDGNLYHTAHPGDVTGTWVMDHPFFLLLNLAVGGNPVENPDESTPDANEMVVNWVRVYERRAPIPDPDLEAL